MAQETKRVPAFLSGPTTATAVLLPMRLYVGYWWLQSRDAWKAWRERGA